MDDFCKVEQKSQTRNSNKLWWSFLFSYSQLNNTRELLPMPLADPLHKNDGLIAMWAIPLFYLPCSLFGLKKKTCRSSNLSLPSSHFYFSFPCSSMATYTGVNLICINLKTAPSFFSALRLTLSMCCRAKNAFLGNLLQANCGIVHITSIEFTNGFIHSPNLYQK